MMANTTISFAVPISSDDHPGTPCGSMFRFTLSFRMSRICSPSASGRLLRDGQALGAKFRTAFLLEASPQRSNDRPSQLASRRDGVMISGKQSGSGER